MDGVTFAMLLACAPPATTSSVPSATLVAAPAAHTTTGGGATTLGLVAGIALVAIGGVAIAFATIRQSRRGGGGPDGIVRESLIQR